MEASQLRGELFPVAAPAAAAAATPLKCVGFRINYALRPDPRADPESMRGQAEIDVASTSGWRCPLAQKHLITAYKTIYHRARGTFFLVTHLPAGARQREAAGHWLSSHTLTEKSIKITILLSHSPSPSLPFSISLALHK